MSSIFGFYYVIGLLRHMGWPRRRSLLNSEAVVNNLVLDSAINQMIDWSACIGACRPNLALQIIATMFRENDWDSEDSFSILKFVNDSKNSWENGGNNPRAVVKPFKFSKDSTNLKKDVTSSKDLKDNRMKMALEQYCIEGLVWGLFNPNRCKIYFETEEKEQNDQLPMYKEAGLDVDSIPTLDQIIKEGEEIIKGYEKEIRPLLPIPQKLIKDVLSLGIEINN
jgi:hypothetical protein